ncbi:FIG00641312: hypothetical protein [Cronobacter sakazakii 696]|nr:FIG00641312: hypothetical protein [Cronobacter sakazakii 696]
MHAAAAGGNAFDFINHVHTFDHFCEHAVAPTLQAFAAEVQEVVIYNVDEKLGRRGVRRLGARHGQRTAGVLQTVVGFVFDRIFSAFLFHARLKTAALNHKAVDYTMENGVVVETFAAIVQKVFYRFRRFVIERLDYDVAVIGVKSNHVCILFCFSGASASERSHSRRLL